MKRAFLVTCPILLMFVFSERCPAALEFLHVHGQEIEDGRGRPVLLRGVGLGNWMLPEGYMWRFGEHGDRPRAIEKLVSDLIGEEKAAHFWRDYRRNYIGEADIRRVAELGFNSVRPALNARLFLTEGEHPKYLDEGFELLDNLVSWCRKYGIYVIIDMHAAPGGQTGANIDDSRSDQPELFSEPANQDRLVELWVKIARRYKDEPAVAGYDLLNEPLPRRTGAEEKYKQQLEPLYRRITAAIRKVDTRHMITLEGADWANDWSAFTRPFDDNLVYQFHYYCWNQPEKLNDIGQYLSYRRKLNRPVWVGETGEKDDTIYWATTDYFESNGIGWSFWPWKKMEARNGPYSIKAPDGWDAIREYSRGGAKPSAEVASKAFDQLLENIRLERCVYHSDVVNALFHRVPGRVEAENYGHEGAGRSYSVRPETPKSKYYRLGEPVNIEPVDPGANRGGQAIRLREQEWTAYTVSSQSAGNYTTVVRVKSDDQGSVFQLSVNNQSQDVPVTGSGWVEIDLKPKRFSAGTNGLKLLAKRGTLWIDWLDVR